MTERARILVVEDDDALRRMLCASLSRIAPVATARDGAEALAWLAASEPPDLIVSDVMMPRVTGLDLARAVKGDARLRDVPLLFLSAVTSSKGVVDGINAGARQYVTKPFKSGDLEERVKRLLARRAPAVQAEAIRSEEISLDELELALALDEMEGDEPSATPTP